MTQPTASPLYCANHPDRETLLRCNRCEKPICYQCAVQTPVGYRCRECVRSQQAKYYNGERYDVPLGVLIAAVLGVAFGVLAYLFLGRLVFFGFIIAFIAGPAAGGAVAEVIRRALRRRRAQGMKVAATVAFAAGLLAVGFVLIGFPGMFLQLSVMLFGALAATTLYARIL
jgi:hypothetical protein